MKSALLSLFSFISLSSFSLSVTLIGNGSDRATLVLPDQALPVERLAAEELQYHLQKASGVALAIVPESEAARRAGPKVYLGNTRALARAGLSVTHPEALEWDRSKYPWHGRLIGDDLYFYGVDGEGELFGPERHNALHDRQPAGTLFAVYDFLEQECGVRWIWPGASGEVIPARETLIVNAYEKSGMPRFINADWRTWSVYHRNAAVGFSSGKVLQKYLREQRQWLIRQRFRHLSPLVGFEGYFNRSKAHLADPDLIAMTPDGKRGIYYYNDSEGVRKRIGWGRVAMCVSHPEQPKHYVAAWRKVYGSAPAQHNTHIVGINEADIPGYCICDTCRAWDQQDPRFAAHPYWNRTAPTPTRAMEMWTLMRASAPSSPPLTDRYVRFWLACLEEVHKIDPDGKIWANAYTNYAAPPVDRKLNGDVLVRQVGWPYLGWTREATARAIRDWDGWHATGAGLLLRPNVTLTGHCLPVFYAREWAAAFSHAAANGLLATDLDSLTGQWSVQGPTLYTIARMHIEPERPVEEILTEFYSAFGPAQKEVTAYFEHWAAVSSQLTDADKERYRSEMEQANETYGTPRIHRLLIAAKQFPPGVMARGRELLEAAKVAAAGDPAAKERVHRLDLGLQYAELALWCVDRYGAYSRTPDLAHRVALDQAVAQLQTFRQQNESALPQNFNYTASEERALWHSEALKQLKTRVDQTSVDAD